MAKITRNIRNSEITCTIYDIAAQEVAQITFPMLGNVKNGETTDGIPETPSPAKRAVK